MAKHWETFEHTADVGLAATGETLGELLEALADGLAEQVCPRRSVRPSETRQVAVTAEDVEALAVDFLWEVMSVLEGDRFMLSEIRVLEAGEKVVRAELLGEPYDPARHELRAEVKAVTYHQLRIAPDAGRWVGRVILDL